MNCSDWQDEATTKAEAWCRRNHKMMRRTVNFEAVRLAVGAEIDAPADGRWWGVVCRELVKAGHLKRVVGWQPAASSHGAPKPVYWVLG